MSDEWEAWRLERLREDVMLAFYELNPRMTRKALGEKFDLKPQRVSILIRRHDEAKERERLLDEIERLRADTFATMAERLWMDLEWLATKLEKRIHSESVL